MDTPLFFVRILTREGLVPWDGWVSSGFLGVRYLHVSIIERSFHHKRFVMSTTWGAWRSGLQVHDCARVYSDVSSWKSMKYRNILRVQIIPIRGVDCSDRYGSYS